jgi:predicted nuclease of restriction endonuclease-like (RecB) superfamily
MKKTVSITHVGDHSYACTVEESGALHNKNNENSIIPNRQIEQGDKQHCVIEDGFVYDNLDVCTNNISVEETSCCISIY